MALIRTIIILPFLAFMVLWTFILFEVADPVYRTVAGRPALESVGWAGIPDTAMQMLMFGIVIMILGVLIAWHWLAPVARDFGPGRGF